MWTGFRLLLVFPDCHPLKEHLPPSALSWVILASGCTRSGRGRRSRRPLKPQLESSSGEHKRGARDAVGTL